MADGTRFPRPSLTGLAAAMSSGNQDPERASPSPSSPFPSRTAGSARDLKARFEQVIKSAAPKGAGTLRAGIARRGAIPAFGPTTLQGKAARGEQPRLFAAAEQGDVADLRAALLEPGADVNFFEAGTHALFLASTAGHAPAVKLLLQHSADPNRLTGGNGKTSLLKAAVRGHTDVMTLLLAAGATDIEKAWDRANALYAASYAGKLDAMRLLLAHGSDLENRLVASPLVPDRDTKYIGSTPLIIASFFDQPGAIAILLAAGADRGARTEQGQTALDVAPSEACRRLLE